MSDQSAQLRQLRQNYDAMKLTLDSLEASGAELQAIAHAKELLGAALAKGEEAIGDAPK